MKYQLPCLLFIALLASPIFAQNPAKIQAFLDSARTANGFPAVRATILAGAQAPVTVVSGFTDEAGKVPLRADDLLLSGSAPKMFYATLTLLLVQDGKLGLDDKMAQYLGDKPWFPRVPNARDITVRQLLNHTAGISEYYELGDFIQRLNAEPDKTWTLEELTAYVLDTKPLNAAGEKFSYADTHYLFLGMILEKVTGKSVYPQIDKRILKPLRMRHTRPSNSRTIKGLACGYSMPDSPFFSGPTMRDGQFVINPQIEQMGGGYATTTQDLATFLHALMRGKILTKSSLETMKTGVPAPITSRQDQYGLGLQIRPYARGMGYGHGGWFPGYLTEVEYFPEGDITVAVQFNTDDFKKLKGHPRQYVLNVLRIWTGM